MGYIKCKTLTMDTETVRGVRWYSTCITFYYYKVAHRLIYYVPCYISKYVIVTIIFSGNDVWRPLEAPSGSLTLYSKRSSFFERWH